MADSAPAGGGAAGCPAAGQHQQGPSSLEDFKSLPNEKQSEEVFRLLSLLSPFASQVGAQHLSDPFQKHSLAMLQLNLPTC